MSTLTEIHCVPMAFYNREMPCGHCGIDTKYLIELGQTVYRKKGSKIRYFCERCKEELFEGVKLRDE